MKITDCIVIGHSFGGYISGLFTIRYPELVKKLVLLSPVGISSTYDEFQKFNKLESFIQKLCFQFNLTPSIGLDFLGVFKRYALDFFIGKKLGSMNNSSDEYETNKDFINVIYRNIFTSENAIFVFFNKNIQPYKPLTYHYDVLKDKKILFLYGDRDWVPFKQAEELKKLIGDNVTIEIISNSGHQLHVDNPKEIIEHLLKFID